MSRSSPVAAVVAAALLLITPHARASQAEAEGLSPDYPEVLAGIVAGRLTDAEAELAVWAGRGQSDISYDSVSSLQQAFDGAGRFHDQGYESQSLAQLLHFWGRAEFLRATLDMEENGTARREAFLARAADLEGEGKARLAAYYRDLWATVAATGTAQGLEWTVYSTVFAAQSFQLYTRYLGYEEFATQETSFRANVTAVNYLLNVAALGILSDHGRAILALARERDDGPTRLDPATVLTLMDEINETIYPTLPWRGTAQIREPEAFYRNWVSAVDPANRTLSIGGYLTLYQASVYQEGTRQSFAGSPAEGDAKVRAFVTDLLAERNATLAKAATLHLDGVLARDAYRTAEVTLATTTPRDGLIAGAAAAALATESVDLMGRLIELNGGIPAEGGAHLDRALLAQLTVAALVVCGAMAVLYFRRLA